LILPEGAGYREQRRFSENDPGFGTCRARRSRIPAHIKLNPPKGKEADVLVVNAAECEPYITSDYRQICEHPDEILDGILSVLKWIDIPRAVIGVENNKPLAVEILKHEIERRELAPGCETSRRSPRTQTIYRRAPRKC
jgi:Na+-translocating ferredoxin:NAD+ oxidoreductase RnfC subunit